ncbi:hypothetical protein V6N13_137969 [Hibiscus sabdariffa]
MKGARIGRESSNVSDSLANDISTVMGVRVSTNPEKYLGLPTMVGRRKRDAFSHYFDRFNKLVDNWNIRNLSKGYKEQRQLPVRNTYPFCESCADIIDHLAFSCPTTLQILAYIGLPPVPAFQSHDFGETFAKWFTQQNKSQQLLLSVPYRVIWYAHNKLVHEGFACSITKSATFICALLLEFESLSSLSTPTVMAKDVKWLPPDVDIIKLNFSASFISSSHSSVPGVIAHDSQAAHALAKLGLQHTKPQYWIEEVPVSIEQVVLRERPS